MAEEIDEMLATSVNQYLSGSGEPSENRIQSFEQPYSDLNTEYALTSDEYTAFFFEQNENRGVRIEFNTEDPSQKIEEIGEETAMEQQTEWRYGTDNAIASISTKPSQAVLEIHQGYDNPEELLKKI